MSGAARASLFGTCVIVLAATAGRADAQFAALTGDKGDTLMFSYSLTVGIVAKVKLARDPKITVPAIVWLAERSGVAESETVPNKLREALESILLELSNDYQAANEK